MKYDNFISSLIIICTHVVILFIRAYYFKHYLFGFFFSPSKRGCPQAISRHAGVRLWGAMLGVPDPCRLLSYAELTDALADEDTRARLASGKII